MDIKTETENLLKDLGFEDASDEEKQKVLAKIQEMVDTEILYTVTSRLNDEQIQRLDQKLKDSQISEEERPAEFLRLLKEELPEYEEAVAQALGALYQRIRNDAAAVKQWVDANPDAISSPTPPTENTIPHELKPTNPTD